MTPTDTSSASSAATRDAGGVSSGLTAALVGCADAILITDLRGRVIFVNPSAEEMSGYRPDELLGWPVAELFPGGRAEARAVMRRLASEERVRAYLTTFPGRAGRRIPVSASMSLLRDGGGTVTGTLGILRDITDQVRAEHALTARTMEAVGRLAGGIAHEVNNLVTVIDGRCELLLSRIAADDATRHDLGIIRGSARRASGLTGQLLAFRRQQAVQPAPLHLAPVIDAMTGALQRLLGEDIELTLRHGAELWTVTADHGQIEQVIMNLAANARDAMPRGGRLTLATANVELDAVTISGDFEAPPGRYVRLEVADTGCGMDEAVRAKVFEPFFTTKRPGQGAGLGLSTVYGIVTQSGGAVCVTSEPGAGAVFTVYLPARADVRAAAETPAVAAPAKPGTETVLLVDDEAEVRVLAREILERQGYVVLEAPAPADALRLVATTGATIDLMLTDVRMPEMTGRELAERVTPMLPRLRVLYMSGYTDNALAPHDLLIAKPFAPSALAQRVREVLDTPLS